jgi:hypothetical protein
MEHVTLFLCAINWLQLKDNCLSSSIGLDFLHVIADVSQSLVRFN